jgi:hypothetical protein
MAAAADLEGEAGRGDRGAGDPGQDWEPGRGVAGVVVVVVARST